LSPSDDSGRDGDSGKELQLSKLTFIKHSNKTFKNMKRKDYQRPTMKVVQLQQQTHLMAGSGVQSMRSGYGEAQEEDWE